MNIIKGYITSLLGLAGVILIGLHLSGIYEFPNPEFLSKEWEAGIGLLICFGLFILPYGKIESFIEDMVKTVIGIFKKKAE